MRSSTTTPASRSRPPGRRRRRRHRRRRRLRLSGHVARAGRRIRLLRHVHDRAPSALTTAADAKVMYEAVFERVPLSPQMGWATPAFSASTSNREGIGDADDRGAPTACVAAAGTTTRSRGSRSAGGAATIGFAADLGEEAVGGAQRRLGLLELDEAMRERAAGGLYPALVRRGLRPPQRRQQAVALPPPRRRLHARRRRHRHGGRWRTAGGEAGSGEAWELLRGEKTDAPAGAGAPWRSLGGAARRWLSRASAYTGDAGALLDGGGGAVGANAAAARQHGAAGGVLQQPPNAIALLPVRGAPTNRTATARRRWWWRRLAAGRRAGAARGRRPRNRRSRRHPRSLAEAAGAAARGAALIENACE